MSSRRIHFGLLAVLAATPIVAAPDAQANRPARAAGQNPRLRANRLRLSAHDHARLDRVAANADDAIRQSYTPIVDLHFTEATLGAGVSIRKTSSRDAHTPTVFEVHGIEKVGGEIELVMTGGASGHVMQPTYGGRPFAEVERYGREDTVHLTHQRPGAARSEAVLNFPSRGLVSQEGFKVKLAEKGVHNFYYFRSGIPDGERGALREAQLRHVQIVVK